MNRRILFVDDDPNILDAMRRSLRKRFQVETATGGPQALALLAASEPFAVVVADMRMPEMTGVELLARIRETHPRTVRMMLTGNADQQTAIDAVNRGEIFRFLNKPCPPELLDRALEAGVEQYRLVDAERELLEQTLTGSVHALTEVLALVNPGAFGRANRIKGLVDEIARRMEIDDPWQLRTATMLSQLGCVVLDQATLAKLTAGESFTEEERQLFEMHPMVGADLLSGIPRLQELLDVIRYQEKNYDGSGTPRDTRRGEDLPQGARILRVALDFDRYETKGLGRQDALARLHSHAERYDPRALEALDGYVGARPLMETLSLLIADLEDGMIVAEPVRNDHGVLLICKGQETTASVRQRLRQHEEARSSKGPLVVKVLANVRYRGAGQATARKSA